jgi:hypothetical protein
MSKISDNNTHLIMGLVFILLLLYTITFTSRTCNSSVQQLTNNNNNGQSKENFYSETGKDFTIVGIGSNTLYTLTITNNGQSGWTNGIAANIPNSGSVIDVCVLNDGSFVGVGSNNLLYTRATLTSDWVTVNNTSMKFAYITQLSDGKFLATGRLADDNGTLYRLDTLTSWPYKVHDAELGKVIQLQDKSFLAVGGGGLDTLYTIDPWFQHMKQITHDNTATKITYVQQGPDGTIYGLLNGNTFAKKNLADLTNESIPWTNLNVCCFTGFTITQSQEQKHPGTIVTTPLTANDYTLVGIVNNNTLCVQDIIGGVSYESWALVANSGSVTDICASPTGVIYGVGMNNQIYSRQTLNSSWVNMSIAGMFVSVSMMNDGHTLLLVGKDSRPYTFDIYNNNGGQPAQVIGNNAGLCKVIQLQDNSFLIVGGGGCDTLYTSTDLSKGWQMVSVSDIGIKCIGQSPNGSIFGLMKDGAIYYKGTDWNTWVRTTACCIIGFAIMPINPQNINGYSRKGAFIDDSSSSSSRAIPNSIGNYNTLPECITAAKNKGYDTVGYQYMNQCWAGKNSPYDKYGVQTNNRNTVSAYPGGATNIVYKRQKGRRY